MTRRRRPGSTGVSSLRAAAFAASFGRKPYGAATAAHGTLRLPAACGPAVSCGRARQHHGQADALAPGAPHRRRHDRAGVGRRDHCGLGQNRDAARPLVWNLSRCCTRIRLAWADAGYAGQLTSWAATALRITVQIVRKRDAHAFEVLPRRWVVERTLAWITNCRRCARDYERLPAHHEAAVYWAMITLMTRRLARPG